MSVFLPSQMLARSAPIEWELEADPSDGCNLQRTGRYRRRQFYGVPGAVLDRRPVSQRVSCEWREGAPR